MSNKSAKDRLNQDGKSIEVELKTRRKLHDFILDDLSNESVEVLRERLNAMKRLVAERQQQSNTTPGKVKFQFFKLT
jgi:hypothetical protein